MLVEINKNLKFLFISFGFYFFVLILKNEHLLFLEFLKLNLFFKTYIIILTLYKFNIIYNLLDFIYINM